MVEERSVSRRRCLVRDAGGIRNENAGISSDNEGEKPSHRKSKVSWARLVLPRVSRVLSRGGRTRRRWQTGIKFLYRYSVVMVTQEAVPAPVGGGLSSQVDISGKSGMLLTLSCDGERSLRTKELADALLPRKASKRYAV